VFLRIQHTEPELSKTFIMNLTSVHLILDSDASNDDDEGAVRKLWVPRETAVTSVTISEHGNARGVFQFDVIRVC